MIAKIPHTIGDEIFPIEIWFWLVTVSAKMYWDSGFGHTLAYLQ